jgi:hypothetical protein
VDIVRIEQDWSIDDVVDCHLVLNAIDAAMART